MNLKRVFGTILTSLGILILLYGGYEFLNANGGHAWKVIITALILGIVFFGSGIGLIKGTQDNV